MGITSAGQLDITTEEIAGFGDKIICTPSFRVRMAEIRTDQKEVRRDSFCIG